MFAEGVILQECYEIAIRLSNQPFFNRIIRSTSLQYPTCEDALELKDVVYPLMM